jgi:hypothetical protein
MAVRRSRKSQAVAVARKREYEELWGVALKAILAG